MKLYVSPTSPYARLACAMCLEAHLPALEIVILDPWTNPPELLAHNPALRVPALALDEDEGGGFVTESLLIADLAASRAQAGAELWFKDESERRIGGICLGAIDAAAAIMAGRMIVSGSIADPAFDVSMVAARRRSAIDRSLDALDGLLAKAPIRRPCIAAFLPVIVVEYMQMRFDALFASAERANLAAHVAAFAENRSLRVTRPLFTSFDPASLRAP